MKKSRKTKTVKSSNKSNRGNISVIDKLKMTAVVIVTKTHCKKNDEGDYNFFTACMGLNSYESALDIYLTYTKVNKAEFVRFKNKFQKHSIWVCTGDYTFFDDNKIMLLQPECKPLEKKFMTKALLLFREHAEDAKKKGGAIKK